MLKSKILIICAIMLPVIIILPACSASQYKDGTYTAEMPEFAETGWKDTMEVTIEGGKIIKISWDAIYKDDSIPIRKKQYSKSGLYGMLKTGAINEWYDQATAVEQFALENGIDALGIKQGGYTDAVTGCTIHINEFDLLIRECLKKAEK